MTEDERHKAYKRAQESAWQWAVDGNTEMANMWANVARALRKDRA